MRTIWYAGLLLLTGIVLFACESGDLNVGQSVINPTELDIQPIDSVTIRTSTVLKIDSLPTYGPLDANIVVGQWTSAQTGKLTAKGFSSIAYTNHSLLSQTNFRLDSLVLELNYAYAYGDTTTAFNLGVYRLTRPLSVERAYYNTSTVSYETTPFLQQTTVPRPRTRPIRMRLPDAVAQEFYTKLVNGEITDGTTLNEFFTGFAFVSQAANGNTFLGFVSSASGLRLFYHDTDVSQTAGNVLFPLQSTAHFTNLTNDRSGTPLKALQQRADAVSSNLTDNTSFISWGAGLQTRLELPYINQFERSDRYVALNSALLVIKPVRQSLLDNTPPPTQLILYEVNDRNEILSTVPGTASGTTAALASYVYDPTGPIFTDSYTFDITSYVGQLIKQRIPNRALLLTVYPPSAANGQPTSILEMIQRTTLGNQQRQNDQMQLQIFATSTVR
ncbi:DUF4270 domain-containing protein [Spirosoma terrae]|uniref:DUF4270 domain-containing protein n=2 Tax=Spirosoma terrae TaxID=1968276 RepID=A0A6L9LET9_9BACT|nr:DUF4270 domain-containing protein [Spirosoma terrae]